MKIGVLTGSSVSNKNNLLYETLKEIVPEYEVINFGCFEEEQDTYSYIDVSVEIALLIGSNAVDFVVTGCSSGQGMMLSCNCFPKVICGYLPTPQDAFLFGRINNGNVASLPLGLGFGWSGELNLKYTLQALFDGPFGVGYPMNDAERKIKDTKLLAQINDISHLPLVEILKHLPSEIVQKVMGRDDVINYIEKFGKDQAIKNWIRTYKQH